MVYVYYQHRDNDGNVTISFWPRVRQGGLWLDGSDVTLPDNDTPETYQIDVCTTSNPATAVNTYTLTGNEVALGATWTYTTAMQTTDLGSPHDPVHLAIYQISQIVGRGFGIGLSV